MEALFVLSALAGIGHAPDAVHGNGQGFVRFLADGAEAHGAGGEALDDFLGRLHFVQGDGMVGILELEQAAQRTEVAILLVQQLGVLLECGWIVLPHGVLQLGDGERIQQVILAALAVLIMTAYDQIGLRFGERLEGVGVLELRLAGQHLEPHALDARGGAGEVGLDQGLVQADGFKHLRAAIALQCADAHFGEGLQQALVNGLDEVLLGIGGGNLAGQQAAPLEVVKGFDGQVGIDGAGAVADEQGKVHHLAGLAALDDERHLGAGLLAHQAVVHGGHGQQAGNGRIGGIDAAVGEDEQGIAGVHRVGGAGAQIFERVPEAGLAVFSAEQRGDGGGQQIAGRDAAQLFQIAVGEDGMRKLERVAVFRSLIQDVALGADVADQGHDQLFADGIDGWIGYLGKQLLEVVEQRLGAIGETGQRDVGAHGADRLLAFGAHGSKQHLQVLLGIAVGTLPAQQGLGIGGDHPRRLRQMIEGDLLFLKPGCVRLACGQLLLDLGVGDDALLNGIDEEHAARLQTALLAHVFGRHVENAGF